MVLWSFNTWKKFVLKAAKNRDPKEIQWLERTHNRVARHFAFDYRDSTGVKELKSPVAEQWVCVDVYTEDLTDEGVPTILLGNVEVTLLVELANGETLSSEEAIGGLGDWAPDVAQERKEEEIARIRIQR